MSTATDPASAWSHAREALCGLAGGRGLNIAYEAVVRHASGPRARVTALRLLDRRMTVQEISYAELADRTARFANALDTLGIRPGKRLDLGLCRADQQLPELEAVR